MSGPVNASEAFVKLGYISLAKYYDVNVGCAYAISKEANTGKQR